MATVGIIGGGNMGTAILQGIRGKSRVLVCEKDKRRCAYLKKRYRVSCVDVTDLGKKAQIIILAVKPQDMAATLSRLRGTLTAPKLVISIAAGITTSFLEKRLKPKTRVIRTMPNMPAQIGEGITAVCKGRHARPADVQKACRIFRHVGKTVVVQEKWIDAITAVSGSGPAYVFLFAECLLKSARSLGLNKALSEDLVKATLLGSLHLLDQQNADPSVLRAKVTSKGGTTQAAMDVFRKKRIEKIFQQALNAACRRAKQLSKR